MGGVIVVFHLCVSGLYTGFESGELGIEFPWSIDQMGLNDKIFDLRNKWR